MHIPIHGMDLHVELRGQGEPLLLLHGFLGAGGDFAHLFDLDALAREYRLVIPDARGHGRSTNPAGTFSHGEHARDVAALLDHLGIARCKAIGLSLGGNTLLHLATRLPQRIEAMVVVSSPPWFPAEARALMRAVPVDDAGHGDAEWRELRAKHVHGDDQIRALWRHARGFAEAYDDMAFTPPLLATIRARTLVVGGDADPFYPVRLFTDLAAAIPGAGLWIIPGGGHTPVFGGARAELARVARAFLRGEATA
jgi:pimeloyl-ACP methyl ester carboxylesterase